MKQIYYKMCKRTVKYAFTLFLAMVAALTTYAQNGAMVMARLAVSGTQPTGNDWPTDVKWLYLTIHGNGYLLEHTDGQTEMPLNNTNYTGADNQLWAFIGNATDGYRLYNKAAGTGMVLSSPKNNPNARPVLKALTSLTENDIQTWDVLTETNIAVAGGFYVREHGNANAPRMNRNGAKLGFWTGVDGGSCLLAYGVNTATQTQQIKVRSANKLTLGQATTDFVAGGRYLFYMNFRSQYLYHDGYNAKAQMKQAPPKLHNNAHLNYVWELEADSEGGFYLKNAGTQKYLGDVTERGTFADMVTDKAQAMRIETGQSDQNGVFGIKKVGTNLFFHGKEARTDNTSNLFTTWDNAGANYEVYPVQTATPDAQPYTVALTHEGIGTNGQSTGAKAGTSVQFYPGNKPLPLLFNPLLTTVASTSFDDGNIVGAEVTGNNHTVAFKYNLPFDLTTDLNAPVWQGMQLGRTQKFTIYANEAGNEIKLQSAASPAERIKDPALWAITGDLVNGFKIYNRQHGTGKLIYSANANNGTPIQMGDATAQATNGLFFLANHGDGYVVYRKNGATARAHFNNFANGGVIKYWHQADDGSMVFFTNQQQLLSEASSTIAEALTPYATTKGTNYLGSLSNADYNTLQNRVQSGLNSLDDFASWTSDLENKQVKYQPNRLYQIIGVGSNKTFYVDYATGHVKFKEIASNNEVAALWKFTGSDTQAKITNPNTGKSIKVENNTVTTVANVGNTYYNITKGLSAGTKVLNDVNSYFLQLTDSTNPTGNITTAYTQTPSDKRTQLHIKLVSDYVVHITEAGYATTMLPFAVQVPSTLEAFIVEALTTKEEAVLKSIPAGTTIPALTPIVLKGTQGTHTLTIDYDNTASPLAGNVLSGMTAPAALEATDFIFARNNGAAGFYKTSQASDAYGPNKAVLKASAVPAGAGGATQFLFEGSIVTGIATATSPSATTTYYNLQGQRVDKPTRGIYITSEGRKVVIK